MYRRKVQEEDHPHGDLWDLAVCYSVGLVSSAGLGQLRPGAVWTRLLDRLDRLWGVLKPRHLHHDSVYSLHIPPLPGHRLHLLWDRLEAAQGVPVHPEQRFSIRQY